jgi:tetratricopeptide (TPR) repeat protein
MDAAIAVLEDWYATEQDLPNGDVLLVGYNLLGIYYAAVNRLDEAAPLLEKSLTYYESPENALPTAASSAANAHDELARYATVQGDFAGKQRHYRRAAALWSEAGQIGYAARSLGNWHQNNGEPLLAADRFCEALDHPPATPDPGYRPTLLVQRMLSLWQASWYSSALAVAREIVSENCLESVGAPGYRMTALAFARLEHFAEGEGILEQADLLYDRSLAEKAHTTGIWCLTRLYQGRFREIIAICEEHRRQCDDANEPMSAQVLMHYAMGLSSMGRFEDADQAYRFAIEQAPITEKMSEATTVALLRCGLASICLERRDYADALSLLQAAEPESVVIPLLRFHVPAARLHARAIGGQLTPDTIRREALEQLRILSEKMDTFPNPTDAKRYYSEVLFHLVRVQLIAGDHLGASRVLDRFTSGDALSPGMTAIWHYWRGRCHEAEGESEQAKTNYETAIAAGEPGSRYVTESEERLSGLGGDAANTVQ